MKTLAFTIFLSLTVGLLPADAQSTRTPALTGGVERAGGQLRLVLTNPGDTQAFQGSASVNAGPSTLDAARFTLTLAPGETRSFPLPSLPSSVDQYELKVFSQGGALVLYKIAPIRLVNDGERAVIAGQTPAAPAPAKAAEVRVNAQLSRGLASRDAEITTTDVVEPFILTFEIDSPTSIKDASFTLGSKEFERRQVVADQNRARLEFKLPESLGERKLTYTLAARDGRPLARGEVDLDQLSSGDAVSLRELTFDRPAYAPGEPARATIELQGDAPRGYRLEVTVKEGGGNLLFKDERRGANVAGKSRQEFLIEVPSEVKGPVIFAYQVFGGQTGLLFDSGTREIPLNDAQAAKPGGEKRISP